MSELYFIRNKYFELLFKILAVAAFVIAAIKYEDFILAFIAIAVFVTISISFKLATLAKQLKHKEKFIYEGSLLDKNNHLLNTLVSELMIKFPNPKGEGYYLNLITDLWERLKYKPPKISASIGLSLGYFFFLFLAFIFSSPLAILQKNLVNRI